MSAPTTSVAQEPTDLLAVDARDLDALLDLDPRYRLSSEALRRRAVRHAHEGAGFRLACVREVIQGDRAKGEWVVYRRARKGKWGRGPVVGRGGPPDNIIHVQLKGIYSIADVIRERIRLGDEVRAAWLGGMPYAAEWAENWATLVISRVADVWTVTRGFYNPRSRKPVPALWVEGSKLREGLVCCGIHAADADELRAMRTARAASLLAERASKRRGDAPARWVSVGSLLRAGACRAGIEVAWLTVRDELGLPPDMPLTQIGAVSVEVVRRRYPEWAHAAI